MSAKVSCAWPLNHLGALCPCSAHVCGVYIGQVRMFHLAGDIGCQGSLSRYHCHRDLRPHEYDVMSTWGLDLKCVHTKLSCSITKSALSLSQVEADWLLTCEAPCQQVDVQKCWGSNLALLAKLTSPQLHCLWQELLVVPRSSLLMKLVSIWSCHSHPLARVTSLPQVVHDSLEDRALRKAMADEHWSAAQGTLPNVPNLQLFSISFGRLHRIGSLIRHNWCIINS